MSIQRMADEDWDAFKIRQREDAKATKFSRQHGKLLVDSSKALGITQAGIDRAKKRIESYKLKSALNQKKAV